MIAPPRRRLRRRGHAWEHALPAVGDVEQHDGLVWRHTGRIHDEVALALQLWVGGREGGVVRAGQHEQEVRGGWGAGTCARPGRLRPAGPPPRVRRTWITSPCFRPRMLASPTAAVTTCTARAQRGGGWVGGLSAGAAASRHTPPHDLASPPCLPCLPCPPITSHAHLGVPVHVVLKLVLLLQLALGDQVSQVLWGAQVGTWAWRACQVDWWAGGPPGRPRRPASTAPHHAPPLPRPAPPRRRPRPGRAPGAPGRGSRLTAPAR